jgi:hypothetical protein
LIAHSYNNPPNEFIVVFNVETGTVLSARSYSSNGYNNINRLVKLFYFLI